MVPVARAAIRQKRPNIGPAAWRDQNLAISEVQVPFAGFFFTLLFFFFAITPLLVFDELRVKFKAQFLAPSLARQTIADYK
jgi:hypothetical protein